MWAMWVMVCQVSYPISYVGNVGHRLRKHVGHQVMTYMAYTGARVGFCVGIKRGSCGLYFQQVERGLPPLA